MGASASTEAVREKAPMTASAGKRDDSEYAWIDADLSADARAFSLHVRYYVSDTDCSSSSAVRAQGTHHDCAIAHEQALGGCASC